MPVMGTRVHLSEQIDLMSEIRAIGFVAPALDPHNAGVNAVGGVGDEVSNAAIVGACAARSAESEGDNVGGAPQLERVQLVLWRARVGLKVTDCRESA
jgi:hypothetical protein